MNHAVTSLMDKHSQQGLTLIELMVSMIIGLLVSAAGLQMFLTSQQSYLTQQASSHIQDNAGFGLQSLDISLRSANMGALASGNKAGSSFQANSDISFSGLVITTDDDTNFDAVTQNLESVLMGTDVVPVNLLSCTDGMNSVTSVANICQNTGTGNSWTGASNLKNEKSDQLVVMYKSPMAGGFDCEGDVVNHGDYVVERYFLRKDNIHLPGEANPLALACDAGRIRYDSDAYKANTLQLTGYGDAGEIMLDRVDHFIFQVGAMTLADPSETNTAKSPGTNNLAYYDLDDYLKLPNRPRITHIRYSVLTRPTTTSKEAQKDSAQRFNMLNKQNLELNTTSSTPYMRKVFTSSVLLRSARG